MSEEIRTPEGQLVTLTPEGEIVPVNKEITFDGILKDRGVMPNREVRTTYSVETPEGKEMMFAHMQSSVERGVKDAMINSEFNLVAATSYPVRTNKGPDGKELAEPRWLIRTVLETDDGTLIPSSSAYVYESLQMIMSVYGKPSRENTIRVKIGKAGQADKLFAVRPSASSRHIANKSIAGKSGK